MARFTDTDGGDDRPGLDDLEPVVELLEPLDEADDDDEDDYPDDATEEDVDLVVALYREDGQPVAVALGVELANDLDELIAQLRRLPGDGGAVGLVSIASEFFVLVRVRGKHVQVLLSDELAANDWPIARDVADFLGSELPDDDEDAGPIGDLDIFADVGLPDFELEALCEEDEDSDAVVERIVKKLKFTPQYRKVVQVSFGL
jgi:putative tRNA adenosine deaminase-associated protein